MAFDKSRPYGTIYGEMDNGARFEQDGIQYNCRGEEVGRIDGYVALEEPPKPPVTLRGPKHIKTIGKPASPQKEVEVENRKALDAEAVEE